MLKLSCWPRALTLAEPGREERQRRREEERRKKESITTVMTPEKQEVLERFWNGYNQTGHGILTLGEYNLYFDAGSRGVSVSLKKKNVPWGETAAPTSGMVRMMGLVRSICDQIVATGKVLLCAPLNETLSMVYQRFGWKERIPGMWALLYYGDNELVAPALEDTRGYSLEFTERLRGMEQQMQGTRDLSDQTGRELSDTQARLDALIARLEGRGI